MAERWLVISYWANCEGITPSYHVDDRLPYLEAAGIEVEVIASVCGPRPPGWGGRWHRVPSFSPSGFRFELRHFAGSWPAPLKAALTLLIFPWYAVEKLLVNLESAFWWWVSGGVVGLRVTRRRHFDLIYSSGGALCGHLAAAWVARRRGIPWVAEIRDPLSYEAEHRGWLNRRVVTWAERMIHRRATGVVYLTKTACARAQQRVGGRAACTAIYAGGEAVGARRGGGGPALRLLHAGSLAGTRNPGALLRALEELAARRPEWRAQLRVILLGSMDEGSRRQVEAFAYPEMVEVIPKRPRAEALELVAEAEVLLVIQNTEPLSAETIPSKVYDYLISGRPILGLLYRNPELAEMLQAAGHRAVEISDLGAIARALEELYAAWEEGELAAAPEIRYTRAGATAEFVAWARELAGKRETANVP